MASAPVSCGDLDQALGDQRPRDRGAEQVDALVERVHAEHREDEVADEFLAQILDVDLLDAEHLGLLARRLQLLALAEIGGEGHDLAAIGRLQPFQDDRGVEPARIGEHDLLDVRHSFLAQRGGRGLIGRRREKRQAGADKDGTASRIEPIEWAALRRKPRSGRKLSAGVYLPLEGRSKPLQGAARSTLSRGTSAAPPPEARCATFDLPSRGRLRALAGKCSLPQRKSRIARQGAPAGLRGGREPLLHHDMIDTFDPLLPDDLQTDLAVEGKSLRIVGFDLKPIASQAG